MYEYLSRYRKLGGSWDRNHTIVSVSSVDIDGNVVRYRIWLARFVYIPLPLPFRSYPKSDGISCLLFPFSFLLSFFLFFFLLSPFFFLHFLVLHPIFHISYWYWYFDVEIYVLPTSHLPLYMHWLNSIILRSSCTQGWSRDDHVWAVWLDQLSRTSVSPRSS